MAKRCENCQHWHHDSDARPDDERRGECRFNPPIFHPARDSMLERSNEGVWPRTRASDWCSHFLSK